MSISMSILMPSSEDIIIPSGSSILVSGEIHTDHKLSDKVAFKCELFDDKGNLKRYTYTDIKANKDIDITRNDLTLYPKGIDDDLSELKDFGFAELLGDNKASSKAYFDDHKFRTFIYSASNTNSEVIFNDGLNLKDDKGNDLSVLDEGNYLIKVSLIENNKELTNYKRKIIIGSYKDTLICRVNPIEHKLNMFKWAKENNLAAWIDDLPGYLTPYHNGLWFYHMGLLRFYRANDICLYKKGKVHMFIYETACDSTSYETEYAYLQALKVIDDTSRFVPYIYDIGETKINGRVGKIIELKDKVHLYRIDSVKNIEENVYDLSYKNCIRTEYDNFEFNAKETIGITGVVKPYQLDPKDFILRDDNTYEINNGPDKLIYEFSCGEEIKKFERELNMLRVKDKPLERSAFEFYNLFKLDDSYKNKTWNIKIQLVDKKGNLTDCIKEFSIKVN